MVEKIKNSLEDQINTKESETQKVEKDTKDNLEELKVTIQFEALLKKDDNSAENFFETLEKKEQIDLINRYGEPITIDGKKTSMKGIILGDTVGSAIYFKDATDTIRKDTRLSHEDIMGITEGLGYFS